MDNRNEIFEVNDELYVREVLLEFEYFYFGIIFRNIGRSMVQVIGVLNMLINIKIRF